MLNFCSFITKMITSLTETKPQTVPPHKPSLKTADKTGEGTRNETYVTVHMISLTGFKHEITKNF